MPTIYLSEEAQYIRQIILHVLFCISTFLNFVSLYCLINQTPPNQAKIRNFLLFVQIIVILIGIYTDLLMEPIPLMPAISGICTGILCRTLPLPTVLGCLLLLYVWLAAAIFFCIFYRHQTLLSGNGKLSKLLVPFVMIAGPTTIMFLSMLCECIPFEVNISLFGVIACHPLVHNLIVLGITPTYRARILALLRKLWGRVLHGAKPLVSVSAAPTSLRVVQRRVTSQ